MKALIAYLRQLSAHLSPGVGADSIRFATIIAPGVDPKRREVMIQMMRGAFKQRNYSQQPRSGRMQMPLELIPHTLRNWELAVWDLQGPPETWGAQLQDHYRKEPVFAVVSGLSDTTWAPVHTFCQQERIPCLFPSVDLPAAKESFYTLYFSRGVALEADVLAKYLRDPKRPPPQRVVQVRRNDEAGRGAALELKTALSAAAISVEERVLEAGKPADRARVLQGLAPSDAVMLWLRPPDLAALAQAMPTLPGTAYVSAVLAGDDPGRFPEAWKSSARLARSPYDGGGVP